MKQMHPEKRQHLCLPMRWAGVTLVFLLVFVTCLAVGITPAWAEDIQIEIPCAETSPTIDGVASEGEYSVSYTMDKTTAQAWVGTLDSASATTWRLAWDDRGLYVCATVLDSTPVYRNAETHWVGADCVEFGLNPGYILKKDDDKGVFFSMGAMENGRVIVYRHNYDERLVSDDILGMATGHTQGSDGYTIEVCIPWSLIFIEADCTKTDTHLDATNLTLGADFGMGMVMASIDAADDQNIGVAYKFNDTDFVTGQYLQGMLTDDKQDTTPATRPEDTQAETSLVETLPQETQPSTQSPTDTTALTQAETELLTDTGTDSSAPLEVTQPDTAPSSSQGGCGSALSCLCLPLTLLCGACLVMRRKKRDV